MSSQPVDSTDTRTAAYWQALFPDLWTDPGRTYAWGVIDVLLGETGGLNEWHERRSDGIWIPSVKADEVGAGPFGFGWEPETRHAREVHPTSNHDEAALPVPCTLAQFVEFEKVRVVFRWPFVGDDRMTRLLVPKLKRLGERAPRALELVLSTLIEDAPVLGATHAEPERAETKEQRQDRRLQACIDAGLPMNEKVAQSRLPDGVGAVADLEHVSRQAFSTDVKAALKRWENATRAGATIHRA